MSRLLLTLDFINEFNDPAGKAPVCAEMVKKHGVIAKANQAIAWARKNGVLIAHVKVGFAKNYANCPLNSPLFGKAKELELIELGGWGTEFVKELDVQPEDSIIIKHRISAFYNTSLETYLRANKIETIILCGVATNFAVEAAAREAHDRDYNVITLKDACAGRTEEQHEQAFAIALGALTKVMTVDELTQLK
ncbi:MAG: isochorismatase family cysteine hydrolase [Gammaproteobacteria bacterium]|nr:isochorismatase family cysteine hydrolase [Gammaproteobacteria bacterium]